MIKRRALFGLILLSSLTAVGCDLLGIYDIRGDWNISVTLNSATDTYMISCSGSKSSGTIQAPEGWLGVGISGTFKVDGKTVQLRFTSEVITYPFPDPENFDLDGKFTGSDSMSGEGTRRIGEVIDSVSWKGQRR